VFELTPRLEGDGFPVRRSAEREGGSRRHDGFSRRQTWAFLLGDASGKGVAAGLVASAVQARVNTAARLAKLDPQALMAAVDRDVYATTDGARYATAVYGTLNAGQRKFTYVNAGHPSMLVTGNMKAIKHLPATGPALGLIEAGTFVSHSIELSPGSVLLAYTDGVNEAQNDQGEEYGDGALSVLLHETRHQPAAQICKTILDAVRAHRGSRQDQDDVTVMVLKAR
jgi:sigma-B regulation protein RsbU (phosphoserine phosphatase)